VSLFIKNKSVTRFCTRRHIRFTFKCQLRSLFYFW